MDALLLLRLSMTIWRNRHHAAQTRLNSPHGQAIAFLLFFCAYASSQPGNSERTNCMWKAIDSDLYSACHRKSSDIRFGMGFPRGNRLTEDGNGSGFGGYPSQYDPHDRRFARVVLADQAVGGSRFDFQIDVDA
jgi:hypothetical protein